MSSSDFYQGRPAFQDEFDAAANDQWRIYLATPASPDLNKAAIVAGARVLKEIATREVQCGTDRYGHQVVYIRATSQEYVASYSHHLRLVGIRTGDFRGRHGAHYVTVRLDDWNERIVDFAKLAPVAMPAAVRNSRGSHARNTLEAAIAKRLRHLNVQDDEIDISNGSLKLRTRGIQMADVRKALNLGSDAAMRYHGHVLFIPTAEVIHLIPPASKRKKAIQAFRNFGSRVRRFNHWRRYSRRHSLTAD